MGRMQRRTVINQCVFTGAGIAMAKPLLASLQDDRLEQAAQVLADATSGGQVSGAVLHVREAAGSFTRAYGEAKSADAAFLLGSIS